MWYDGRHSQWYYLEASAECQSIHDQKVLLTLNIIDLSTCRCVFVLMECLTAGTSGGRRELKRCAVSTTAL